MAMLHAKKHRRRRPYVASRSVRDAAGILMRLQIDFELAKYRAERGEPVLREALPVASDFFPVEWVALFGL